MIHAQRISPITNRLFDRLGAKDRARVMAACDPVELGFKDVISEPGEAIKNVYFPTASFISLLAPMGGKSTLEVSLAGNEGVYGIPVALGMPVSPVHALVQGAGPAWRMSAAVFRRELAAVPRLAHFVDLYIHVLMSQIIQTAGCNRFHVVEQRLARWLLMTADRAHTDNFHITHEFLAHMLGVRRVGVTKAATALQKHGLITYKRGALAILDRPGLEAAACHCYRTDLSTYERILG